MSDELNAMNLLLDRTFAALERTPPKSARIKALVRAAMQHADAAIDSWDSPAVARLLVMTAAEKLDSALDLICSESE